MARRLVKSSMSSRDCDVILVTSKSLNSSHSETIGPVRASQFAYRLVCCLFHAAVLTATNARIVVREYVFYVFSNPKNATFPFFEVSFEKKRKKRRKRCPSVHSSPL